MRVFLFLFLCSKRFLKFEIHNQTPRALLEKKRKIKAVKNDKKELYNSIQLVTKDAKFETFHELNLNSK